MKKAGSQGPDHVVVSVWVRSQPPAASRFLDAGTLTFYWMVSSDGGDYLKFYIDGQQQQNPIAGVQGWTQRTYYFNTSGTHTLKWSYVKDGSGSGGSDCGWVDRVVWTPALSTRTLADAVDSFLTYTTDGDSNWLTSSGGYFDTDCAQSGDLDYDQSNWLQTTVTGPGTVTFLWKAPGSTGNPLEFRTDGTFRYSVSDQATWQQRTYTITGAGTHTLTWTYSRGSDSDSGYGYVDYVQWTGPLPQDPPADAWRELVYVYDASGRRIEKKYNSVTVLKYIYDGHSCIAEYDASSNLRRKYIYGPGIDQPVCMIEATVSPAATYYYHFDALGSVTALTNSSGNTVEVYDYSVYGQVGASDASHPNRFMFTGREFDKETGLYYYRARYYKPEIGRFLQADQVGYGAGMNLYRYCSNNPWNSLDPLGKTEVNNSVSVTWSIDHEDLVDAFDVHGSMSARLQIKGQTRDGVSWDGTPPNVKVYHDIDRPGFLMGLLGFHADANIVGPTFWQTHTHPGEPCDTTIDCAFAIGTFTWGWQVGAKFKVGGVDFGFTLFDLYVRTTITVWICADGKMGHKVHSEDHTDPGGLRHWWMDGRSDWNPPPEEG